MTSHTHQVGPGDQCAVPAGTRHHFRNIGDEPLVLCRVDAPHEYAAGAAHPTKEQTETAEATGQDETPAR